MAETTKEEETMDSTTESLQRHGEATETAPATDLTAAAAAECLTRACLAHHRADQAASDRLPVPFSADTLEEGQQALMAEAGREADSEVAGYVAQLAPDARARVIAAAQAPEGGAVEAVRAAVLRLARQHDGIVLVALLRLQVQHLDAATVERSLVELERLRVLDLQIANDPLGPTAEGGWRIDGRGWIAYVVVHEVRR